MIRFLKGLGTALIAVLVLGGLAVGAGGGLAPDTARTTSSSEALAQTEDDAVEGESGDEEAVAGAQLSPIEQLLARLTTVNDDGALPSAQRVVLSRDPFQPVIPEPASDGGGGDGTDGDGTDGNGDGTDGDGTDGNGDGTDGNGDGTDGDGTDACTGDENETVCDGVVVTLDGFTEGGLAIVTVDGTGFTVGVDDEFATSFRVLAINDPCVTLLFGDEAFSICSGATVLK